MAVGLLPLWGATLAATTFLQKTAVKIWLWFLSIAGTLATVALSETVRQGVAALFN
jgi:hypothetical protein